MPRARWFWLASVAVPAVLAGAGEAVSNAGHECDWVDPYSWVVLTFGWLVAIGCAAIAGWQSFQTRGRVIVVLGAVGGGVLGLVAAPFVFFFVAFVVVDGWGSC